jgi:hypothetical protein
MTEPVLPVGGESQVSRPHGSTRNATAARIAMGLLAIAMILAFVVVWALPNMVGTAFLQVRTVVSARAASNGPVVLIARGSPVRASAIDVSVEIVNHYPLGVVVAADTIPFQAVAYERDLSGGLTRVWSVDAADPALEEGSDSPAAGSVTEGAATLPPGVSRHHLTPGSIAFALVGADGTPLPAGVFYIEVWAYGIGSVPISVAIDGAVDNGAPPSDLPHPSLGT